MQPKSINRIREGIQIEWQDGHVSPYSDLELRRRCPCAVCKEIYDVDGRVPLAKLGPAAIQIDKVDPIGWYAFQFRFSDGHDTGIYSFEMLRKFCTCKACHQTA